MRVVTLIFPDVDVLEEFLLATEVAYINKEGRTLKAMLSDDQIVVACTTYKAYVQ